MRPIRLTMQAFGSYSEKTVIDFTVPAQNIFLITGDTGAGKSTIFDAIVFTLYGETASGIAKKDGAELQSHFAPTDREPFTELVFTEQQGEDALTYTVKRVPKHTRPLKHKNKTGTTEEKERVTIFLPDGTELALNKKESDAKIEEIIGLTKDQFMQVVMIAQGEFMELLRASSDERKMIFRKLFGTRIYQDIVEEIGLRRKELQTKMKELWMVCRSEAGHVRLPKEEEQAQKLREILSSLTESDQPSITALEGLTGALQNLCVQLSSQKENQEEAYKNAAVKRDRTRDAYQQAKNLKSLYEQYKTALKELDECEKEREDIRRAVLLAERIDSAFEVKGFYEIYQKAKAAEEGMKQRLSEQKKILPRLIEEAKKLENSVAKSREELESLKENRDAAEALYRETGSLQKDQLRAEQAYREVREKYLDKNREYIRLQTAYYDEQAGILAKTLEEGKPCPVCGSLDHPDPAGLKSIPENLSKEQLEGMRKENDVLQKEMNEQASLVRLKSELLLLKKENLKKALEKLLSESLKKTLAEEKQELEENPAGETAAAVLSEAQSLQTEKEAGYKKEQETLRTCRLGAERADALITQFEKDLPGLEKETLESKEKADKILLQKRLSQEEWQKTVQEHTAEESERLKEKAAVHERKKLQAESRIRALKETVPDNQEPDLEKLDQERVQAEQELDQTQKALQETRQILDANEKAAEKLIQMHAEHQKTAADAARIESLYNRLAGKVTGSRMDIETFVQRYYLERILSAANLRFFEMSGGQYELRIFELDRAGEGRNRGLDLMVYSTVTGKPREIKTLSGGESFMAALSLALGMADQIQRSCASVNLDIMFIDEGFGSLDDRSRTTAVRVLKQMAGGSRTIGIISHVAELKQEVEDILSVTKNETGSTAVWQSS